MIALLELVTRLVVEAAALKMLDRAHQTVPVAGKGQPGNRRERIHDRHHVRRSELALDELDEGLAHDHVVAAADMVVVEQNDEQAHVRALRLARLVVQRANLGHRRAIDLLLHRIDLDDRE